MEGNSFNLEKQINDFLENFKQSANRTVDDDEWSCRLTRSKSKVDGLEMTERFETPVSECSHRSHSYQHQTSVNGTSSAQNMKGMSTTSDTAIDALNLNGSESLSSILTRSSCDGHKQKKMSNSSNDEPLRIADVADLLHPQYAIITGGRATDGAMLISFPDHNNFHLLTDCDYQSLIQYLIGVTSLQDADLGFQLIVDRRNDKWTSVKAVLQKISSFFPGLIHAVYVLRPSGFFQKAISEVSSKLFKEDSRFKLIICGQLDELHKYIPKSQLTMDLGGDLFYSHHEWIQQRISLEKFSALTTLVAANLEIYMRQIHDTEFPNSVEATEELLIEQGSEYTRLKEEILSAGHHGEELLAEIKRKMEMCVDRTGNICAIERRDLARLLVQLQETEMRFDQFYNEHMLELRRCLELRRFEHDFRELQAKFDLYLKIVGEMTEIGETVSRMDQLIEESKAFENSCQPDVKKVKEVIAKSINIIEHSRDMVEPKANELRRVAEMFSEKITRRLEMLSKARELMERVEKANDWCGKGIDLLASQRIENVSVPPETAIVKMQEIECFIESADDFQLSSLKEESSSLQTIIVTQVLQRIDDVKLMCEKRVATLKKLSTKPALIPVCTVAPEPGVPLQPNVGAPNLLRPVHRKSTTQKIETIIAHPQSYEGPMDSGVSVSSENLFSLDDSSASSQTDIETHRLKRVLAELLDTERIYVAEMGSILQGYRDKLLSEEMASIVPAGLQGNADILFGNLHELYTFHSETFLKDLENCISTTELVALCFVQRRDVFFRLYSYYCQNIPRSERLRETLVDTHLFLQECQKKLGHKLPLAAYLLKPVQRITKYQLLLKDLLKFSDTGTCTRELQKALDCMLVVLKCVNDSMHQIAITGFPADLSQQGDLLLQDSFQIWTESKKDIRLRLKPQSRHIFLYQKAMLFCKQDLKTGHNKSTYQFKHWLKMSLIGLTESVRGDQRRFEVWLQGRSEVHTFQAPTIEIKAKWVSEIKKVLMNQLEELKDEKIKQYGNAGANHRLLIQPNVASNDGPLMTTINQSRTLNTEHSLEIKCMTTPIVSNDEGNSTWNSARISASSSEHGENAWSSDYSNSEDEYTILEENFVPKHSRNSAQLLVEACNLNIKEKIKKYQTIVEEPSNKSLKSCSVAISKELVQKQPPVATTIDESDEHVNDTSTRVKSNRLSNMSVSSITSDKSDSECEKGIEYGTSKFYVNWDD